MILLLVSKKPTGSLIYGQPQTSVKKPILILSTGTGLAPFMSVVRDPEFYDAFENRLNSRCSLESELGYFEHITEELPDHEHFGELIQNQLILLSNRHS